jgi:hypothetical protein
MLKLSGTRVLDLSYTFMFNKRHQPGEHLLTRTIFQAVNVHTMKVYVGR